MRVRTTCFLHSVEVRIGSIHAHRHSTRSPTHPCAPKERAFIRGGYGHTDAPDREDQVSQPQNTRKDYAIVKLHILAESRRPANIEAVLFGYLADRKPHTCAAHGEDDFRRAEIDISICFAEIVDERYANVIGVLIREASADAE